MDCARIEAEAGRATNAITASNHWLPLEGKQMAGPKGKGSGRPRHLSMREVLEWSSIPEPNSGCHLWIKATTRQGYGQFSWNDRLLLAHRAAYEATHGPIPPGMVVCHKCDVPGCVNPAHLFVGSQKANMADAQAKGRAVHGIGHSLAKLTDVDARNIFASRLSYRQLAARYGVSVTLIYRIKKRLAWAHVH